MSCLDGVASSFLLRAAHRLVNRFISCHQPSMCQFTSWTYWRLFPITPRFMFLDHWFSAICPAIIPSEFLVWRLSFRLPDLFSHKTLVLCPMSLSWSHSGPCGCQQLLLLPQNLLANMSWATFLQVPRLQPFFNLSLTHLKFSLWSLHGLKSMVHHYNSFPIEIINYCGLFLTIILTSTIPAIIKS